MDSIQDLYREQLVEIKRRHVTAHALITGDTPTIYNITTIESASLQVRKILELIAFSSLIANKEIYSEQQEKFASHWNARLLLQDLERVNPKFYPEPIDQKPSPDPKLKSAFEKKTNGYLTKNKFIKVYEKCGAILHADNPFGKPTDFEYYEKSIPQWLELIKELLNSHIVRLVGDEYRFYLFQMNSDDNPPTYNVFQRLG